MKLNYWMILLRTHTGIMEIEKVVNLTDLH